MHTVAVVCRTIEDEINAIAKTLPNCCPIYWAESSLHNFPLKQKDGIQQGQAKTHKGSSKLDGILPLIFGQMEENFIDTLIKFNC